MNYIVRYYPKDEPWENATEIDEYLIIDDGVHNNLYELQNAANELVLKQLAIQIEMVNENE